MNDTEVDQVVAAVVQALHNGTCHITSTGKQTWSLAGIESAVRKALGAKSKEVGL